jgi:molybdopterin molybdotransferase
MISTQEAFRLIQQHGLRKRPQRVAFQDAWGCQLAEDLRADMPLPPFDRVMMDGIAVRFSEIEAGCRQFTIAGIQAAGQPALTLPTGEHCLEVMTGAVCPLNADTIIPYEHLTIASGVAHVNILPERIGKNIHPMGSDRKKGDVLVESGSMIGPAEIGVAASIGASELEVYPKPTIAICSTGDELVDVQEKPLSHQIRRSNVYAIQAALHANGYSSTVHHVRDDQESIARYYQSELSKADIVIWSGGVSAGKFDYIPQVMQSMGVQEIFHRIEQRPGKPMWFGVSASQTVFGLPGNPISTLACLCRYILPWLRTPKHKTVAKVLQLLAPHAKLTFLVPVTRDEHGEYVALSHRGSGDFSALAGLIGFAEFKQEDEPLEIFHVSV